MKFPAGCDCYLKKNVDGMYANQHATIDREKYKNNGKYPGRSKWVVDVKDDNGNIVHGIPSDYLRK